MHFLRGLARRGVSMAATASVVFGFAMATGISAPIASASGLPGGVSVYVGYADSAHATAAFPVPWDGAPGVQFDGCQPVTSCTFDGGTVMIANNSTTSITVDSISVAFVSPDTSTCTFSFWTPNLTVGIGGAVIYAQTTSGASAGCGQPFGQMDSSDIGPDGSSWVGQCGNSGVIPEVELTVTNPNGTTTTTMVDSGQVLNTGGIDLASCPGGPSEAEQWTPIGGSPCPSGATVSLSPAAQSLTEGGTGSVVANVTNGCGNGIPNVPVSFTISGPNSGASTSVSTDANGNATLTYSDVSTGTDTIGASFTSVAGTFYAKPPATISWTESNPVVSLGGTNPGVLAANSTGTFTGSFTDSGGAVDTYTATWNWGDGSNPTVQTGVLPGTTLTATHAYASTGVYPVTLTITDEETGTGSATAEVAVYNPGAGFVTGGGWIDSGAGACGSAAPSTCGAATAGKANFGFVSMYKVGASTPSGQTEFQFQAGGLDFHSTAYSVLIVQGSSGFAQYDGTGTLNGVGGYSFILTAYDHDISNSAGTVDGFRIQISDSGGNVVYDNCGSGACSQAGPLGGTASGNTQPLGGGDIVIHKS